MVMQTKAETDSHPTSFFCRQAKYPKDSQLNISRSSQYVRTTHNIRQGRSSFASAQEVRSKSSSGCVTGGACQIFENHSRIFHSGRSLERLGSSENDLRIEKKLQSCSMA